jgi:hypothetical protein
MTRRHGVCLALLTLALAGCGGGSSLGTHALTKDVESIQSLAAEGSLLAKQVAHGDVTGTFVRVHTQYLEKVAGSLRRTLATARVPPGLAADRRKAARLASTVDRDLRLLHRHPSDRAVGERVRSELARAARQAEELAR